MLNQMTDANIVKLSKEEDIVLRDTEFLMHKHSATNKIQQKFMQLRDELKSAIDAKPFAFPVGTDSETGRIFKGESYLYLPYVNLDYPRKFGTEDVFAFRSMCWWGNFFSFTLHLQGESFAKIADHEDEIISSISGKEFYISVHETPWQYHYGDDNYIPVENYEDLPETGKTEMRSRNFLKLSRKLELTEWDEIDPFGVETLQICLDSIRPYFG